MPNQDQNTQLQPAYDNTMTVHSNIFTQLGCQLRSINSSLVMSPTPDNGHTAAVSTKMECAGVTVNSLGMADPSSAGSQRPMDIINAAQNNSEINLVARFQNIVKVNQQPAPRVIDMPSCQPRYASTPQPVQARQGKGNGGGSRPASQPQTKLIEQLCRNQGVDLHSLCQQVCGRTMTDLRGSDANILIRKLQEPVNG